MDLNIIIFGLFILSVITYGNKFKCWLKKMKFTNSTIFGYIILLFILSIIIGLIFTIIYIFGITLIFSRYITPKHAAEMTYIFSTIAIPIMNNILRKRIMKKIKT